VFSLRSGQKVWCMCTTLLRNVWCAVSTVRLACSQNVQGITEGATVLRPHNYTGHTLLLAQLTCWCSCSGKFVCWRWYVDLTYNPLVCMNSCAIGQETQNDGVYHSVQFVQCSCGFVCFLTKHHLFCRFC
jgi:hypothetical protein